MSVVAEVAHEIAREVNSRFGNSDFVFYVSNERYKIILSELAGMKKEMFPDEKPVKGVRISGVSVHEKAV